ncbi:MAG TPA: SDR family oxidoreductase [Chthoniobacterales bacterium]|jgi:NAD(P)-dependent dehydrogenase (short-subunit alcohol dehydrogenase family)
MSFSSTILITGANRGIGLALVSQCLALEYNVVATARNPANATDLLALARRYPEALQLRELDVNSDSSVANFTEQLTQVDVLVNNAAVFPEEGEETVDQWQMAHLTEAFQTNVVGVARVTQALLGFLEKSKAPRVVNISSTAGSISGKYSHFYYAYSTSKAALNMLTRAMAFDLRNRGITVVAVHPGWVQTEMGGADATLTPQESAGAIARMIGSLTLEQAACFLERDGTPCPHAW